jgi:hypothetical protein
LITTAFSSEDTTNRRITSIFSTSITIVTGHLGGDTSLFRIAIFKSTSIKITAVS